MTDKRRVHPPMLLPAAAHGLGPVRTIFTSANGVKAAPIQARDDARADRPGEERNAEWRGLHSVPFGLQPKSAIRGVAKPCWALAQLRLAPGAWHFLAATHLVKIV